jgi:ABC-type transport system involved in cytochrome bd biosynthesis fused ATPase/permease subunit
MIQRILAIAGRSKTRIILGVALNFLRSVSIAIMLLAVFVVFEHLDALTPQVITQALWILIAGVIGRFLFQWLTDIAMSAKGFDMFRDYRLAVGEKLKAAPMGYFSEQRLGTIQTILTSTVVELEQFSMLAITDITGGVSMAVIIIVMLAFYSLPIALLSLAGLAVGLLVLRVIQKRATIFSAKVQAAQEKMVTEVLEYIRGIAVLRAFLQDKEGESAVYQAFEGRRQAAYEQEHAAAGIMKLYSLVFKLTSCGLLFLAVALYLNGAFPLSYCLMFLVSAFLVYAELETMGGRRVPSAQDQQRAGPAGNDRRYPVAGPHRPALPTRFPGYRAAGRDLRLRQPHGHRPRFPEHPPGHGLRHRGAFGRWQDHPVQPDRPLLGRTAGQGTGGRTECEGPHRRQPARSNQHGISERIFIPRYHREQHQIR